MTAQSSAGHIYRHALEGDWPEIDLEFLGKCPVCSCARRSIAYDCLQDKVFFCAPGIWTLWRCLNCDIVYLDPRPTQSSIGRAYETYYTHGSDSFFSAQKSSLLQELRRVIANSYLNKKFGYKFRPALPLAYLLLEMQPRRALRTSHFYRHLPAPQRADDCLLDIGCGRGEFLRIARDQLKYEVEGMEIDPRARAIAESHGLKVHASSMPGARLKPESYFQITLNHVLEHLHDPVQALKEIFCLLKRGGRVWISVPNVAANSLKRFGSNSRLLEPPRHLVMFSPKTLKSLLTETGFERVHLLPEFSVRPAAVIQSLMIERGIDPYGSGDAIDWTGEDIVASRSTVVPDDTADFFTMTGFRPL